MIHEKNLNKKSRDTVRLSCMCFVNSLALESLDLAPHVAQVIGPQLASVDALGKTIVRRMVELLTVIDYTWRNGRLIYTIICICTQYTDLHTYQHGLIN
jgi:hypothetical protein